MWVEKALATLCAYQGSPSDVGVAKHALTLISCIYKHKKMIAQSGSQGYKTLLMLNSTENEISTAHEY